MNNNAMSKNPHIARFTITEYSSIREKFNNQINLLENIIDKTPKKIIVKISDLEKIKDKITGELYNLIYLRAHGIDYRHFSSILTHYKKITSTPVLNLYKKMGPVSRSFKIVNDDLTFISYYFFGLVYVRPLISFIHS